MELLHNLCIIRFFYYLYLWNLYVWIFVHGALHSTVWWSRWHYLSLFALYFLPVPDCPLLLVSSANVSVIVLSSCGIPHVSNKYSMGLNTLPCGMPAFVFLASKYSSTYFTLNILHPVYDSKISLYCLGNNFFILYCRTYERPEKQLEILL